MIELTDILDKLPLIQYTASETSAYWKNLYSFSLGIAFGITDHYVTKIKNWNPVGSIAAGSLITWFNQGTATDLIADTSLIMAGEYLTFKTIEKIKQRKNA